MSAKNWHELNRRLALIHDLKCKLGARYNELVLEAHLSLSPERFNDLVSVSELGGITAARARADAVSDPNYWREPEPIGGGELPPFPVNALAPWQRGFVEEIADKLQVTADLPGSWAIAALSVAVRGVYEIALPTHCAPLVLWVLGSAEPGEKKSPILRLLMAPIRNFQIAEFERLAEPLSEHREIRQALDAKLKAQRGKFAGGSASKDDILTALRALEKHEEGRPRSPRIIVEDTTNEALAQILGDHEGRIALVSSEAGWFTVASGHTYGDGHGNIDAILKAFDGDCVDIDRKNGTHIVIERACLAVALGTQPRALEAAAQNASLRQRGFFGRFLFSRSASLIGRRADEGVIPEAATREYSDGLSSLLAGLPSSLTTITCSRAAKDVLRDFARRLEPRHLTDFRHLRDWSSKLVDKVGRIAGLLHLAASSPQKPVSPEAMERAIEIGEYFAAHAKHVYSELEIDSTTLCAREIEESVAASPSSCERARDLWRKLSRRATFQSRGRADKSKFDEALRLLVDSNRVRVDSIKTGGRPLDLVILSPYLRKHVDISDRRVKSTELLDKTENTLKKGHVTEVTEAPLMSLMSHPENPSVTAQKNAETHDNKEESGHMSLMSPKSEVEEDRGGDDEPEERPEERLEEYFDADGNRRFRGSI